LGSGILYDPSGLILTNSHVVTSLNPAKLVAVLPDGRSLPAKTVGYDDWTDVAVVKVDAADLPWVPLSASQPPAVGQRVVAIGYAPRFPGGPSAKAGDIRSLTGRIQPTHDYPLFNLISSNVYLDFGDSGGPLLNLSGQVVGINTATAIGGREQILAGFSISVEGARPVLDQLVATGAVPRPHLGISVADVTPSLAAQLGLSVNRGVLMREVLPDSPAAAAGINNGDVIVAMDGSEVASLDDLRRLMVRHQVGEVVTLAIVSPGQPRRNVQVTLAERPVVKLALLAPDAGSPPVDDL
jgi:S1-C subfamily serine protease